VCDDDGPDLGTEHTCEATHEARVGRMRVERVDRVDLREDRDSAAVQRERSRDGGTLVRADLGPIDEHYGALFPTQQQGGERRIQLFELRLEPMVSEQSIDALDAVLVRRPDGDAAVTVQPPALFLRPKG